MCKLKCKCGGSVNVAVDANRFMAQCKECHYRMSGELSHTSSGLPVEANAMLGAIARIWVEFGSGGIEGDRHTDKNEVTLNNGSIGNNVTQGLIRTRDDFPGWFDNKEDLKNV